MSVVLCSTWTVITNALKQPRYSKRRTVGRSPQSLTPCHSSTSERRECLQERCKSVCLEEGFVHAEQDTLPGKTTYDRRGAEGLEGHFTVDMRLMSVEHSCRGVQSLYISSSRHQGWCGRGHSHRLSCSSCALHLQRLRCVHEVEGNKLVILRCEQVIS